MFFANALLIKNMKCAFFKMVPKIWITILLKDLMKCYLNLVLVTSFLTKQENGNARHDASQKTIQNSTLLHSIGILANQAKATKRTTAACKIENRINFQLIDSQFTKNGGKMVSLFFLDWNWPMEFVLR